MVAKRVLSDHVKTVFTPDGVVNPDLTARVTALEKLVEDSPDDKKLEERLARLTSGMVTIKVGGSTAIEVNERIYRYEDSVNATRSATEHGYLVGGGMALFNSFKEKDHHKDIVSSFRKFCEGNVRQIAENCGEHADSIVKLVGVNGYNANTGDVEDLLSSGVIDPYKVTEMAVRNSISVANALISSNYIIINEQNEGEED